MLKPHRMFVPNARRVPRRPAYQARHAPEDALRETVEVRPRPTVNAGPTFVQQAERFLGHLAQVKRSSPRTIASYRSDYQLFTRYLERSGHSGLLADIGPDDIEGYMAACDCRAPTTILRRLTSLSSLFRHFVRRGLLARSPVDVVDRPKRPKRLPRCIANPDLVRLLNTIMTPPERAVILTLVCTGVRLGELLSLQVGDVNFDEAEIRVVGKGDKERAIAMPPVLVRILTFHLEHRGQMGEHALFLSERGTPMDRSCLRRLVRSVLKRAGIGDRRYTPHSFRHTYLTLLARDPRVAPVTIKDLAGHASIAQLDTYVSSSRDLRKKAAEFLPIRLVEPQGEVADGPV